MVEKSPQKQRLYLTTVMKRLSEAEAELWDHRESINKIGVQSLLLSIKIDLMQLDKDVSYCEIKSPCGHDAFLLEFDLQNKIIKSFLDNHLKGECDEQSL